MRVIRLLHVFVIGPDQGQTRQEKDCFDMFELTPLTKVFASEFRIFLNSGTENKPLFHIYGSPVWTANSCAARRHLQTNPGHYPYYSQALQACCTVLCLYFQQLISVKDVHG